MKNSSLITLLVIISSLIIAGCVGQQQSGGDQQKKVLDQVKAIQEQLKNASEPQPAQNTTAPAKVPSVDETVKTPIYKVETYLREHPVSTFSGLDKRLIEVEISGTKSITRFRVGTSNPRQESTYLLGVQFLVFPEIKSANVTGYNSEGQIIMSPDSRTDEKRSTYWKKYRTQAEWFPNVVIPPECKVDTECDDKDECTRDICLPDGFCSNARLVKSGCGNSL